MIRATPARDLMAAQTRGGHTGGGQTGGGAGDDPWIGHDPRLTLAREDGRPATGAGDVRRVQHGAVGLRAAADWGAGLLTELLYGETFAVHDEQDDWAWGQAAVDGYVGYLPRAVLGPPGAPPGHRMAALLGHRYAQPDVKAAALDTLPFGARLAIADGAGSDGFLPLEDGGWVAARHVAPIDAVDADPVATAERFAGLPYLWGGRTPRGLDCSALIQLALAAAGRPVHRDSDLQAASLGQPVTEAADLDGLERGDVVFFPGHVGFMVDATRLLHANATHMAVTVNPLDEVIAIVRADLAAKGRADDAPVTAVARGIGPA